MRKTTSVSKSDFIRSLPDLSVAEVIAKGKESKMTLTPSLVYGVRSNARLKPPVSPANGNGDGVHRIESAFLALASEIGLSRAADLLSQQRSVVTKLLG
jgi:hypothetical protein